jgi:hypothetical protein
MGVGGLGVVLVYFLSCDVLVCVRITHCACLACSCDINKSKFLLTPLKNLVTPQIDQNTLKIY